MEDKYYKLEQLRRAVGNVYAGDRVYGADRCAMKHFMEAHQMYLMTLPGSEDRDAVREQLREATERVLEIFRRLLAQISDEL